MRKTSKTSRTGKNTTRVRSPGFSVRMRIPVHGVEQQVWAVAWSCDGKRLATASDSGGDVWDVDTDAWEFRRACSTDRITGSGSGFVIWSPIDPDVLVQACGYTMTSLRIDDSGRRCSPVWRSRYDSDLGLRAAMSFSPAGDQIAVAFGEPNISIIDAFSGEVLYTRPISLAAKTVRWSPDGSRIMAFGDSGEATILPLFGDPSDRTLSSHPEKITWATWSPDGTLLCTSSKDHTVRVWDAAGQLRTVLEGHTASVACVEFSHDGRLLYSVGTDRTLRCWRPDTWQCVATIGMDDEHRYFGGLAANPTRPVLARRTNDLNEVELFDIALDRVPATATTPSRTYVNAKVVLLGDTGVGKSGLGLVLSSQPYRPTDSTHARQVWTFDVREVGLPDGRTETREILLWDLAGQPGYRLIHQLHLAEAAAALVVFDARSESDPFAGVRYWMRALRQYRNAGRPDEVPTPAFLVAARVDRGGIPASKQRITALCDELGVVKYLETSAKEGWGIIELAKAIRQAIDWAALPRSVSTELFETIKRFLIDEKDTDRVLTPVDDLFRLFITHHPQHAADDDAGDGTVDGPVDDGLRAGFETCVRLLEGRDLVRRLSFGGLVLLRPELLDAYASALIDAARGQPDGLGNMSEDDALAGRFPIPEDVQLPGPAEKRLLLIATVEELLRHDLVLREPTDGGVDLIFPSQFTQDRPDAPDPAEADVVFEFDGAVKTVYATLAVRLSHVVAYRREEMWRNASTYLARVGGTCGLRVREVDEGRGELTLFFDEAVSEETRFLFEDYVHAHLMTRALSGSVRRERVFTCAHCGYRLPADLVRRRQSRGDTSMRCPDCERIRISLLDREDRLGPTSMHSVRQMNASADASRDRAAATATIRGKEAAGDYDVFLSYNFKDRAAITEIAERLRAEGVLPWFDTSDIAPGRRWPDELERQIRKVSAGAVFIGPHGLGPWQELERQAFVNEHARRELRVIPVLLPGTPDDLELPVFLGQWHAVDFRRAEPDPFDRLLWAVTGERWRDAEPS